MEKFERPAQVGRVDTFSFNDAKWLDGEAISSLTVEQAGNFVDVIATAFDGTIVTAKVEGIEVGTAELHYIVTTVEGRSHCIDASIIVLSACNS